MWVSRYVVWLIVFSVFGWIYESTYCTIQERKWDNRGFLYGPLCPIYGVGAVLVFALWAKVQEAGMHPHPVQIFLVAALGSAVLEYVTSWVLEMLFHARWWDYSDMPLNLNGRICLPATILFGLAGLAAVYVVYDPVVEVTDDVAPIALEALSLVLIALVASDLTLTVSALTRFAAAADAIEKSVNEHMERLVEGAEKRGARAAESLEAERERFAASIRASRLDEMSAPVLSAARRVRVPRPSEGKGELAHLWNELRHR